MSTTLPNGLIAIDEGNTAWYSDITANWALLDQKVGTVNALKPVATSGDYNDLTNKPTIPAAANDGTITITVNGATAGTFSANQANNSTINVAVPTRTSQLTNDSDFITSDAVPTVNDGTLTIKVNGATAGTFTANQATNEEINITAGGDITYATDADVAEMAETWSV